MNYEKYGPIEDPYEQHEWDTKDVSVRIKTGGDGRKAIDLVESDQNGLPTSKTVVSGSCLVKSDFEQMKAIIQVAIDNGYRISSIHED